MDSTTIGLIIVGGALVYLLYSNRNSFLSTNENNPQTPLMRTPSNYEMSLNKVPLWPYTGSPSMSGSNLNRSRGRNVSAHVVGNWS